MSINMAEYIYDSNNGTNFDQKIDVHKWFTRQVGTLTDGKYDISIRKDGMMCNPNVITQLACANAFNVYLEDYAAVSAAGSVPLVYTKDNVLVNDKIAISTHNFPVSVDWHLTRPFIIPQDIIEDFTNVRVFSEYQLSAYSTSKEGEGYESNYTKGWFPSKVLCNCVACYDGGSKEPNKKIVITVIGCGYKFYKTTLRGTPYTISSNITEGVEQEDNASYFYNKAQELNAAIYDWYITGSTKAFTSITNMTHCLYASLAVVSYGGETDIKNEYYRLNSTSRYHIPTCSTILLIAKYITECDEEEKVNCDYETFKTASELSRNLAPYGAATTSYITEYRNYTIGTLANNHLDYGNQKNMADEAYMYLKNMFCLACKSDNTYAIYALLLHIYKGLNHVSKDTVSPLIESHTSLTDGRIEISFPEMNSCQVETAAGDSGLNYIEETVKYLPIPGSQFPYKYASTSLAVPRYWDYSHTTDGASATETYEKQMAWRYSATNKYCKVDLTNSNIVFSDFDISDTFTFTFAISYKDMEQEWLNLYDAYDNDNTNPREKEILIAEIGNAKIYFCIVLDILQTGISSILKKTDIRKGYYHLKIINGNQQIYRYIGPYIMYTKTGLYYARSPIRDFTLNNITYEQTKTNLIITVSYSKGLWDVMHYYESRGR